jgi:DNA-binding response OmpR family regulator
MDVPPLDPDTIRVLVVDDDVDTADSAVLVLKFLGFEAAAVYDGGVALEQARKLRPQAVLLDLAMPHLDGLHLAQELRRSPRQEDVMLICVSGYGTERDRQRSRQAGCAYHFVKPADWQEITAVLAQLKQSPAAAGRITES